MTLYINACPREESRTARLARAYLARISDVTELNIYDQPLVPLNRERLAHRESLIAGGKWHDPMFDYAHQFADADDIIIAAPYWDLGFPAQLKTYIENIYVPGIVSAYNDHGQPCGLCRARSLTYITTADKIAAIVRFIENPPFNSAVSDFFFVLDIARAVF